MSICPTEKATHPPSHTPNSPSPLEPNRTGELGDVYVPRDFRTGESRGFGFVRYYKKEDAERAMEKLDGKVRMCLCVCVSPSPSIDRLAPTHCTLHSYRQNRPVH